MIKVPVVLGNLSEKVASVKNINSLKKQLNTLTNQYLAPKYLSKESQEKGVYLKDQRPYYDPTSQFKQKKIAHLTKTIKDLGYKLNDYRSIPHLGLVKVEKNVQNFVNKNKENTNKFIGDSYYYKVNKSTLQKERVSDTEIRIGSPDKYYDRTEQTLVEADTIEKNNNLKKNN